MRTGEKVILVVGAGLALAVGATCLSWLVVHEVLEPQGGWFAYAPNSGAVFGGDPSSDRAWAALWSALIWVTSIGLWVTVSLRIWRRHDDPNAQTGFVDRMRDRED